MKKLFVLLGSLLLVSGVTSCGQDENTIYVCASEIPHKQILEGVVKDVLKEKGYNLNVTVLNWTMQNDAVANNEYDANYFQHIPYLNTYKGSVELVPAAKVHYEKLCVYTSNKDDKQIDNGDSIELVNDISNIERALKLLEEKNILTINESCYVNGEFTNFNINNPTSSVTFNSDYSNCKLTCIAENLLCNSLNDYDFGIIPGNTALTGLKDYKDRVCFGEENKALIDEKSNVIAVRKDKIDSPKTKALVEAIADERVKTYIENTFGDAVLYNFVDLTK